MSNFYGNDIHSSPKETQVFGSCISFGEDCMPLNLGSYIISRPYVRVSEPGSPGKMDSLN